MNRAIGIGRASKVHALIGTGGSGDAGLEQGDSSIPFEVVSLECRIQFKSPRSVGANQDGGVLVEWVWCGKIALFDDKVAG